MMFSTDSDDYYDAGSTRSVSRRQKRKKRLSTKKRQKFFEKQIIGFEKYRANQFKTCLSLLFLIQLLVFGGSAAGVVVANLYSVQSIQTIMYIEAALECEFFLFSFFGLFYISRHVASYLACNSCLIFILEFCFTGYVFFKDISSLCQDHGCTFVHGPLHQRIALLCTILGFALIHVITTVGYLAVTTAIPTKEQLMIEDMKRMKRRSQQKRKRRLRRSKSKSKTNSESSSKSKRRSFTSLSRSQSLTQTASEAPRKNRITSRKLITPSGATLNSMTSESQIDPGSYYIDDSVVTNPMTTNTVNTGSTVVHPGCLRKYLSKSYDAFIAHSAAERKKKAENARIRIECPQYQTEVPFSSVCKICLSDSSGIRPTNTPSEYRNDSTIRSHLENEPMYSSADTSMPTKSTTKTTNLRKKNKQRPTFKNVTQLDSPYSGATETTNDHRDVILPNSFTNITDNDGCAQAIFAHNNPINCRYSDEDET